MSRARELMYTIPPASQACIALCVAAYGWQLLFDPNLHHYTFCPRPIIHLHEYYRFITSTLFHGSVMHIAMNMMSTATISSMLEKRFGTLMHSITVLWAIILVPAMHTVLALLASSLLGLDDLMYQHSVGFSGVIFHMSVLEANLTPHRARSVFGFATVPSFLYPWALLGALQVFMPNLSFMGHLSGILTGTLQLYGVFDFFLVGPDFLVDLESYNSIRLLTSLPNFVKTPSIIETGAPTPRDPASLLRAVQKGFGVILKLIRDILETIKYCIFGSGREANANILLSSNDGAGWSQVGGLADTDDDDWVGLAPLQESQPDSDTRLV